MKQVKLKPSYNYFFVNQIQMLFLIVLTKNFVLIYKKLNILKNTLFFPQTLSLFENDCILNGLYK